MLFKKRLLIFALFIHVNAQSQNSIEPYIGISSDQENNYKFKQANIGLQLVVLDHKVYNMLFTFQGGLPVNKSTGIDKAYALNSELPLVADAYRETKVSSFSFGFMHRFKVATWQQKNSVSLFVSTNFLHQHIKTDYEYNKTEYTILNPHRNYKKNGFNLNFGVMYAYWLNNGHRLFAQGVVSTPATNKSSDDLHGYKSIAPIALHLGYAIKFKK